MPPSLPPCDILGILFSLFLFFFRRQQNWLGGRGNVDARKSHQSGPLPPLSFQPSNRTFFLLFLSISHTRESDRVRNAPTEKVLLPSLQPIPASFLPSSEFAQKYWVYKCFSLKLNKISLIYAFGTPCEQLLVGDRRRPLLPCLNRALEILFFLDRINLEMQREGKGFFCLIKHLLFLLVHFLLCLFLINFCPRLLPSLFLS